MDKDNDLKNMEGGNNPNVDGTDPNAPTPDGGSLGALTSDIDNQNSQKTDDQFKMNSEVRKEWEQAAQNVIAKINNDLTRDQGAAEAGAIKNASDAKTAADQANNSWGAGIAKEMVNISTSFGGGLGGGAGGVVGDAIHQAILNHQNHHGGGHHGGGGGVVSSGGVSHGGSSGGKHVSSGGGTKKTGGAKKTGDTKKTGGTKKTDDTKKTSGKLYKCSNCGKEEKYPLSGTLGRVYCSYDCFNKKEDGDSVVDQKRCSVCGKLRSTVMWDSAKKAYVCGDCNLKQYDANMKSSSDSGKANGTYSSSNGSGKKTEYGAYTCSMCGKKTNSIVSGVGSGVYCSNACYQKFLNSRKKK